MKKLLIHIGTAKTGTSSIQQSLLAAQREGKLNGISYPDFTREEWPRANPHSLLGFLYRTHSVPRVFRSERRQETLKTLLPRFQSELTKSLRAKRDIIFSTEYMAAFSREEAEKFKADLAPYRFDDAMVVVYVRRPASLYLSLMQQALVASSAIRDPRAYRYRFRRAISTWSDTFGGRIVVRPFDRAMLHRQCVVQDFLEVAGGFFGREVGAVTPVNANESLSAEACVILQRYRRLFHGDSESVHMPDSSKLVRVLKNSRAVLPQTSPRLKPEVASMITRHHQEDLMWLKSEHGIDFLREQGDHAQPWRPAGKRMAVSDIMESRNEVVEKLLFHALREALQPRQKK